MHHIALSLTKLGIVNSFCLTKNSLQNIVQTNCFSIFQKRITTSVIPKLGHSSFLFRMDACKLLYPQHRFSIYRARIITCGS